MVPYGWRRKEERGMLEARRWSPLVSRDKWPGTTGEVLGAGAGWVSSPVTSDSRPLFPFEVKGQR